MAAGRANQEHQRTMAGNLAAEAMSSSHPGAWPIVLVCPVCPALSQVYHRKSCGLGQLAPSAHHHRRILESGAGSRAAEQMIKMTLASEFLLFLETV